MSLLMCGHMCVTVCLWRSEGNLWELLLSFPDMGSGDGTQAIRLGNKFLYLPSHSQAFTKTSSSQPNHFETHCDVMYGSRVHSFLLVRCHTSFLATFLEDFSSAGLIRNHWRDKHLRAHPPTLALLWTGASFVALHPCFQLTGELLVCSFAGPGVAVPWQVGRKQTCSLSSSVSVMLILTWGS